MRGAALELWHAPRPKDLGECSLENARRRFVLGNLSGLWDALAYCSRGRPAFCSAYAAPEWLIDALLGVVVVDRDLDRSQAVELEGALHRASGRPLSEAEFHHLSPVVLAHLRRARGSERGRHSRWWRRWLADLIDFERANEIEDLRGRVRELARESLAGVARSGPGESGVNEVREWARFQLHCTRWSDDELLWTAAAVLSAPEIGDAPRLSVRPRALVDSWRRHREVCRSEPWRYNLGPLAFRVLAEREELRQRRRRASGHQSPVHALFEQWRLSCSRSTA